MAILLKYAGLPGSPEDGTRILLDRKRPRGMVVKAMDLRAWLPELAPSVELESWYMERPRQWPTFRRRYLLELRSDAATSALTALHTIAAKSATLTLLTSSPEPERSHAAILRDLLNGVKKPPSTTGPIRAESSGRMRARRSR